MDKNPNELCNAILDLWFDYIKIRNDYWNKIETLNNKYIKYSIELYGDPIDFINGISINNSNIIVTAYDLETYEQT